MPQRRLLTVALVLGAALGMPASAGAGNALSTSQASPAYKVLVVTAGKPGSRFNAAGMSALQAIAAAKGVSLKRAATAEHVARRFTRAHLSRFATVVFLGTGPHRLFSRAQRKAFKQYFQDGGGFLGIGSAIETEPAWSFLTDLLGTRAAGRTRIQSATVKVADRVHDASKDVPEYWERRDAWYNFAANVRGVFHVLATVVEDPFGPQPQGQMLDGIAGGTMGADHPVSWCKDTRGGRSFYTGLGNTRAGFADAALRTHLGGALDWAAGVSDSVYSDCGATVLSNYRQVKITPQFEVPGGPAQLGEPIGFDQLPDGRIVQTARDGTVRLHDPSAGTSQVIANVPVYIDAEDGLYGPAVDNDFVENRWVYLYYSPPLATPPGLAPLTGASVSVWDPWIGHYQLSRFKLVEAADGVPAHLDLDSEQEILRVPADRGACCHVAGDIDFDDDNNLWLVTGDDSAGGGGPAGGFSMSVDGKTDELQTVRVTANGGTFTLAFDGQTTSPIPFDASGAQVQAALESLSNIAPGDVRVSGTGDVSSATQSILFMGTFEEENVAALGGDASGLTGAAPAITLQTTQQGGLFRAPLLDARRTSLNTNDLRGKILRIRVKDADIAPDDFNELDLGAGGAYTVPAGNLFPLEAGAPQPLAKPEIYAMGLRNPFRLHVDDAGVAYVGDYGPDAPVAQQFRGPVGTGRYMVVREPANYGWPICMKDDLPYYRWNGNTATPRDDPPQAENCSSTAEIPNESWWNANGGWSGQPGRALVPPITNPEVWYSYRDNAGPFGPQGTPCFEAYGPDAGSLPPAPGSITPCPRLFPELFTGGVGPHPIATYDYDPDNPSPHKFPPYYDKSMVLGEWMQDTFRELKLDGQGRVFKINSFLPCGNVGAPFPFECENPMDLQWGADGALYLLTYGDGFRTVNADAALYRWEYVKSAP